MTFLSTSYQRLDNSKYDNVEAEEDNAFHQTNQNERDDDNLVGYSIDFSEPKNDFIGNVKVGCVDMKRKCVAAMHFVVSRAFGKWWAALLVLLGYIALTVVLSVVAVTGKYRDFRTDISLNSFMVPDIEVSKDYAAFNAANDERKSLHLRVPPSVFMQQGSCIDNTIDPTEQHSHRVRRSSSNAADISRKKDRIQGKLLATLNLVYVAKGDSNDTNIFTRDRLQEIHKIERTLMKHEGFKKHCYISDIFSTDDALKPYGFCTPPNSLTAVFFRSTYGKYNKYDGQGRLVDVDEALTFLESKKHFYSYVSEHYKSSERHSNILRAQLLFGRPVEGVPSSLSAQRTEFKRYVRTYVDTLEKLNNNNQVTILYGGGDLFDYLVDRALLSDVHLVTFSFVLIVLLLLILTFSWWLSFMAVFSIAISVAVAYFFYRVVFGVKYMGILNGVSLFVIIGIGVDDIFVFVNTFRQAVNKKDLGDRIFHTISVAGKATLFTSFTTAAAFGANALSPIPAIHDFGLFMAILVASCWVSVLFIMSPALSLWHSGIEKLESAMCKKVLSAVGLRRSERLRLPDDIRRFLSGIRGNDADCHSFPRETISLSNIGRPNGDVGNDDDDDDDDVPLLDLSDEPHVSVSETDSIAFRLQSILYHYVAVPVVKVRWGIVVVKIIVASACIFLMTRLQVSSEQPKFFKSGSNLQRWLELPEVSLRPKTGLAKDLAGMMKPKHPSSPTATGRRVKTTAAAPATQGRRPTSTTRKTTGPITREGTTATQSLPAELPFARTTAFTTGEVKGRKPTTRVHFSEKEKRQTTTRKPEVFPTHRPSEYFTKAVERFTEKKINNRFDHNRTASTSAPTRITGLPPTCPPCANGGTCVISNGSASCHCRFPFTGRICSKYCPVKTLTGNCCVIPFRHKKELWHGCLIDENNKPWCSLTDDFDKDRKKGFCNTTVLNSCERRTLTHNKTCCYFPFVYQMVHYYDCFKVGNTPSCGVQPRVASQKDMYPCEPLSGLVCNPSPCRPAKPPPDETTALVYIVFGIKGIDRNSVDLRHVLKKSQGKAIYDEAFAEGMCTNKEQMIKAACRICLVFSQNKELVRDGGAECFPKDILEKIVWIEGCQHLKPTNSKKIKSLAGINRKGQLQWFAMAFSSTTGKLSSYSSQHKDYKKWEKQLKDVLSEQGIPPSMKSAFQTSETWVKMFSGIIVVDSAIYGIAVSLLLCMAAVIIFTGHLVLFFVLFTTILGVLLAVMGIFNLTGWQLGGVEAISLSILVGTSVDYCFHLVEGYILAGEAVDPALSSKASRQWRAKAAVSHIGMSIISSAITTILAAIPLCFTQIQLFAKFGLIVSINTAISLLFTFTVTIALLSICAPARFRASFLASMIGLIAVGVTAGLGVLVLYLVSKGGHCIESPSGTPLFKC